MVAGLSGWSEGVVGGGVGEERGGDAFDGGVDPDGVAGVEAGEEAAGAGLEVGAGQPGAVGRRAWSRRAVWAAVSASMVLASAG